LSVPLHAAGFERVDEQEVRFMSTTAPGRRFWTAPLEMTFGTAVTDLPAGLRKVLDQQIEAAFEPSRSEAGYRLATHVRLVSGQRHV